MRESAGVGLLAGSAAGLEPAPHLRYTGKDPMPRVVDRTFALAALVAVVSSGTGLPMCVRVLAQAVQPCVMHTHQDGAGGGHKNHHQSLGSLAASDGQACHPGDHGVGCSAAGSCPSAGAGMAAQTTSALATLRPLRVALQPPAAAFASFCAPPLSPPPQA